MIGLLRYRMFYDLFTYNNPAKFGGESVVWLMAQISQFYSLDDQRTNGVVGIEFRVF